MSHVKKLPSLPPFFRSLKSHNNRKKVFVLLRAFAPQTDSAAACVGPINGPVCALPRGACFPGRPLRTLPGQSAAAAEHKARIARHGHDQVQNGSDLGANLFHRFALGFTELSIRRLVHYFFVASN